MYNPRKFKLIAFFISVLIMITSIQETYGKYKSDASGTTNMAIARWNIRVNNQDIISNNQITNTLNPYFVGNTNIADGVIAPTAVGYFDVNMDLTAIDVTFNYSIQTTVDPTSAVTDLKVIGYSINGGAIVDLTGTLDFNETIAFDALTKIKNIRIYVKWDDTDGMTNAEDTMAALSSGSAKMNVALNFTQIAN